MGDSRRAEEAGPYRERHPGLSGGEDVQEEYIGTEAGCTCREAPQEKRRGTEQQESMGSAAGRLVREVR